jgi:hypothetical protein
MSTTKVRQYKRTPCGSRRPVYNAKGHKNIGKLDGVGEIQFDFEETGDSGSEEGDKGAARRGSGSSDGFPSVFESFCLEQTLKVMDPLDYLRLLSLGEELELAAGHRLGRCEKDLHSL